MKSLISVVEPIMSDHLTASLSNTLLVENVQPDEETLEHLLLERQIGLVSDIHRRDGTDARRVFDAVEWGRAVLLEAQPAEAYQAGAAWLARKYVELSHVPERSNIFIIGRYRQGANHEWHSDSLWARSLRFQQRICMQEVMLEAGAFFDVYDPKTLGKLGQVHMSDPSRYSPPLPGLPKVYEEITLPYGGGVLLDNLHEAQQEHRGVVDDEVRQTRQFVLYEAHHDWEEIRLRSPLERPHAGNPREFDVDGRQFTWTPVTFSRE